MSGGRWISGVYHCSEFSHLSKQARIEQMARVSRELLNKSNKYPFSKRTFYCSVPSLSKKQEIESNLDLFDYEPPSPFDVALSTLARLGTKL